MDESLLLKIGEVEEKHWWFAVRRLIVMRALERLDVQDSARVLEIGCGTGGFMRHLREAHPTWHIQGVEPNAAAAEAALGRECSVSLGALPHIQLPAASFDLVVALDVLEHCEDDRAAAREVHRLLADDGFVALTVPALPSLWSIHDEDNAHFRRYTRRAVEELLASSGFQAVRLTYFNTLLLPLGYASRTVANLARSRRALGVETPPAPVNALLKGLFGAEAAFVRRRDLPVGMSILAIARKGSHL